MSQEINYEGINLYIYKNRKNKIMQSRFFY